MLEKEPKNVVRDIDTLLTSKAQFCALADFFAEHTAPRVGGGRPHRWYEMTRDGFSLLAMGFTGKRALEFKLSFIDAFNRMETALTDRMQAEHRDRLARVTQAQLDAEKQRDALDGRLKGALALSSGYKAKSERLSAELEEARQRPPQTLRGLLEAALESLGSEEAAGLLTVREYLEARGCRVNRHVAASLATAAYQVSGVRALPTSTRTMRGSDGSDIGSYRTYTAEALEEAMKIALPMGS